MKRIGIQIKERRKALEITQTELAELAGISTNTVVAVERGQGDPKISTYLSICEVLGLEMATKLKGRDYETLRDIPARNQMRDTSGG